MIWKSIKSVLILCIAPQGQHLPKETAPVSPKEKKRPTTNDAPSYRRLIEREQLSQAAEASIPEGGNSLTRNNKLKWESKKQAPCEMYRASDAVIIDSTVYFNPAGTNEVYSYSATTDKKGWSKLPNLRHYDCTLVAMNNVVVTIGGRYPTTNKLYSLSVNSDDTHKSTAHAMDGRTTTNAN